MHKTIHPILYLAILLLLQVSCKKEPACENADDLEQKEKRFLVGSWKWKYTIKKIINKGTGAIHKDTIFEVENNKYVLDFESRGVLNFVKNDIVEDQQCLNVVNDYSQQQNEGYYYNFALTFDQSNTNYINIVYYENETFFKGVIFGKDFPFTYEETDDEQVFYDNYYEKL